MPFFQVRPFDTGDRVVISKQIFHKGEVIMTYSLLLDTQDTMIVERIGLLFTHFKSTDGKTVYIPNSQLTIARIENHQRTEEVSIGYDLDISFRTELAKLAVMEKRLNEFIQADSEVCNHFLFFVIYLHYLDSYTNKTSQ
jgi:small-conductance mechanosensitive channel